MSTIKSSNEHLTLNADGSSKDIKFQANGVEKGSLSSTGVMTATSFAGSGASLTGIADATKVPLAGGTMTGVLINKAPSSGSTTLQTFQRSDAAVAGEVKYDDTASTRGLQIGTTTQHDLALKTHNTNRLQITYDGRGLSQFTAKAWVNFNGSGTLAVNDSHNVSSVSDHNTGFYTINFSNNMANANFSSTITAGHWETEQNDSYMVASLYDTASGQTTSSQKFRTIRLNSLFQFKDPKTVCATFFGD